MVRGEASCSCSSCPSWLHVRGRPLSLAPVAGSCAVCCVTHSRALVVALQASSQLVSAGKGPSGRSPFG
eukprot:1106944-Alexandrium_andersonii.AAC.1